MSIFHLSLQVSTSIEDFGVGVESLLFKYGKGVVGEFRPTTISQCDLSSSLVLKNFYFRKKFNLYDSLSSLTYIIMPDVTL